MERPPEGFVRVGAVEELRREGCRLVTAGRHAIALFCHGGRFCAVDNRCPHMGFPLHRGSVKDGILTCHWHHARFDLEGGGTFDPWADDVQTYPVRVVGGEVWLDPSPPRRDPRAHWGRRLEEGLRQNIRLVMAKAVIALATEGAEWKETLRAAARFGTRYNEGGWGSGLTILTAMANLLPHLREEDRPRALYQGVVAVARDCAGEPPRHPLESLPGGPGEVEKLLRWFRRSIEVRDAEGAERCLRAAIERGAPPGEVEGALFAASTDHLFVDGGHALDFANKAFELLAHIGWQEGVAVLTSLVPALASARRSEESSAWREPVDLVALLKGAFERLPSLLAGRREGPGSWMGREGLARVVLGEDPGAIVEALSESLGRGAREEELAGAVAYAAARRVAQFHTANEFSDWDTVLHTFSYANAVHQALRRRPSAELLRAVFDGAISVYLDRFLNTPPAPLPSDDAAGPPPRPEDLLDLLDSQQRVEEAGALAYRFLASSGEPGRLLAALGAALLREDAAFHTFQMVEAGFRQFEGLRGEGEGGLEAGRHVMVAAARYLAAHSPTPRATGQTYQVALRLHRGEELFREG